MRGVMAEAKTYTMADGSIVVVWPDGSVSVEDYDG